MNYYFKEEDLVYIIEPVVSPSVWATLEPLLKAENAEGFLRRSAPFVNFGRFKGQDITIYELWLQNPNYVKKIYDQEWFQDFDHREWLRTYIMGGPEKVEEKPEDIMITE